MLGPAAMGLVVEQAADSLAADHRLQRLREQRVGIGPDGEVHAEIENAVADRRLRHQRGERTLPAAHIGAASDLALDQSAPLSLGIGARHRADGDAEPIGEVAMGREAVTVAQTAPAEIRGQRIDDGEIARTGKLREIGLPNCHGDNVSLESESVSRQYFDCRDIVLRQAKH